jgi:FkbH-like protein
VNVIVAATFQAEPLRPVLTHLLRTIDIDAEVTFAPYNQVVQQLLDPASAPATNDRGVNVVLMQLDALQQQVDDVQLVIEAVRHCAASGSASWIVASCPPLPAVFEDDTRRASWQQAEDRLCEGLAAEPGLVALRARELLGSFRVDRYYDAYAHRVADLPYTPACCAAMAAGVARRVHAFVRPARKVLVLDCDNTLWAGRCGEDGVAGLAIDASARHVQRFAASLQEAGVLLCLCSKNDAADVWQVFDTRADMILTRRQIVAWRIDWRPKSENLRALSDELQLGLDTFVFLDDDAVECAEVRARLPEMLTLQLPAKAASVRQLLDGLWAFDRVTVTDEDRQRTEYYHASRERARVQERAVTLDEFIAALDVRVAIDPADDAQLTRIAQLTQRTTQCNCTLRRRSAAELRQLRHEADCLVLAVRAADRFGDYGLVGTIIARVDGVRLVIDTFLLSCRALGRNIERQMLRAGEEVARLRGCAAMHLPFVPGPRNAVAKAFLDTLEPPWMPHARGGTIEYVRTL